MKKLFILILISITICSYWVITLNKLESKATEVAAPAPEINYKEKALAIEIPDSISAGKELPEPTKKERIDNFFHQLYNTSIAFTVPEKVNIEEQFEVRLVIDPSKTESELVRTIDICSTETTSSVTLCGSETYSDTIQVSKVVIAELKGNGFDVKAITPIKQPIAFTEPTEWLWQIQPKEVGTHKLYLTVNAVVEVEGEKETRQLRTFKQQITIEITPVQVFNNWFKENWQWFWSALIVPIFVYIWTKRKKK